MSNAKQIIAMLKSRAEGDDDLFFSIALQVAAAEARQGHRQIADEMRLEVDRARSSRSKGASIPIAFGAPRGSLEGLLVMREPKLKIKDVVLNSRLTDRIADIVLQQRKRDWLREHGKTPTRNILFVGLPGSGKTMSAEALAGELNLPLYVIRLEGLITKFMGETAAKLRLIFAETAKRRGVYLFDEFDAVGSQRTATNDVAEMRRVLNSFLQFMEESNSTDSLIICATNHPSLLDRALLRRYDQVLEFKSPSQPEIKEIINANLRPLKSQRLIWKRVFEVAENLSQAELTRAVDEAVKAAILGEKNAVTTDDLVERLQERHAMRVAFFDDPEL